MAGMVAPETYDEGDLIYIEGPFAKVLPRRLKDKNCETCSKGSTDLIPCNKCLAVKYCSKECQEKDLSDHSLECGHMSKLEDGADDVRLMARIIFKVKDKNWKELRQNILGTIFSFEDADCHYEEMTKNPRLVLFYKQMKESLKEFIGEANMPKEDDLIKIVGKTRFDIGVSSTSLYFYLGLAFFGHECIPNANGEIIGNELKIWAIRKINADSEKITISHRDFLSAKLPRFPSSDDCLSICNCKECSAPYGETMLTKIIDEKKAYEVINFTEELLKMVEPLCSLDLEENSLFKGLVNRALKQQEGVLGNSNALRLKLLYARCFKIGGPLTEIMGPLTELETHMSAVFGEMYLELGAIYKALCAIHTLHGSSLKGFLYYLKYKKLRIHVTDDDDDDD